MRLPVVLSVFAHVAIAMVALRLPAARMSHAPTSIEVEVHRPRAPEVKTITPAISPTEIARPEPPKLAMRTERTPRERERPELAKKPEVEEPRPPETHEPPRTEEEPPPSSLSPRAAGRIDLMPHSLPIGSGGGELAVPTGGGQGGTGTVGGPVARKPWKPRLDAGDPITGKIAEEKKDDYPLTSLGRDGYVYKGGQFSAHIARDGSVSFDDKIVRDFKGLSGTFDVADLIMKSKKEDPYRHEKKKFLTATTEMRDKLAKQARTEEMQESLASLPTHLLAVWGDHRRTVRERREVLFALWKESATTEDDRSAAGAEARKIIEGFIRDRLPQGSPDGFSDDDLAALNQRGHVRFDPYR